MPSRWRAAVTSVRISLLKRELDWNQIASFLVTRLQYSTKKVEHMRNIALAVAAAAVCTSAPLFIGSVPAKAESLKMAQLDVQVGRDRDDHAIRERRGNTAAWSLRPSRGMMAVG